MTRMGKQEIGIMSGRVGIHEISLQNLYVDTEALRVKDLYINYHAVAIAARMMVLLVGVVYICCCSQKAGLICWFNLQKVLFACQATKLFSFSLNVTLYVNLKPKECPLRRVLSLIKQELLLY